MDSNSNNNNSSTSNSGNTPPIISLNNVNITTTPTTSSTTPTATLLPIIKTSLNGSRLELNEVVYKETYVLRNFKLINTVDYPVQVKLTSDLKQIAFQLNNENMQDDSNETPIQDDDYNQLFNEVNLIDSVVLAPRETKNIIISFRPYLLNSNKDNKALKKSTLSGSGSGGSGGGGGGGEDAESDTEDDDDQDTAVHSRSQQDKFNYFQVKGKIYLHVESLLDNLEPPLDPAQKDVVVDVFARICKSLLKVDINELIFDDCVVGSSYVKDITIWNKCEMPLVFSIYCKEKVINFFQFTDYATGLPLTIDNQVVQSYSSMTMRVTYQPNAIGQFTYKFKLENKNDSNNNEIIMIHSSVSAEQQVELLQVSNNVIEFGDCYTDVATYQKFTIKNISEDPVDINFSSDLNDDEFTFHFHEEDVDLKALERGLMIGEHRSSEYEEKPHTHQDSSSVIDIKEQIEELTINPGSERIIQVRYCPKTLFPLADSKNYRLTPKNFRIMLKYGKSLLKNAITKQKNKTIKVASRVCLSAVKVPTEINLGDCTVGNLRTKNIHLHNLSDLPAALQVRYQSKVISLTPLSFNIPPKQSYDLQLDFLPRKNNPDYRKQITFVNVKSPTNDQQFLEIRANNLDEHSVNVHSKYYHLEMPLNRNNIDFGEVIVNCSSVRTFNIKNISKGTLELKLSTSLPDEIKLYQECDNPVARGTSGLNGSSSSTIHPDSKSQSAKQNSLQEYISKFFEGEEIDSIAKNNANSQYLDLALIPKTKKDKNDKAAGSSTGTGEKETPTSTTPNQSSNSSNSNTTGPTQLPTSTTNSRANSRASSPSFDSSNNNNNNNNSSNSNTSGTSNIKDREINNSFEQNEEDSVDQQQQQQLDSEKRNISLSSSSGVDATTSTTIVSSSASTILQFVNSFEENDPPLFTDAEAENIYISSQIDKFKKLDQYVQSGRLKLLDTITIPVKSEVTIYMICVVNDSKRPWLGSKLKNMEAKLFISLQKVNNIDIVDSPVRELSINTKVCKSIMDLAQRNINFGNIVQYDYRTKSLVINNLSQVPLIYRIKKSGSITSGNLSIVNVDRMGIVRPYRKREVQFVFKPTFSGVFDEKLVIENIYDSANNQTVHIKANVKKPRHFFLNTLDIDFGLCMIKGKSFTKRITLTNTSNQNRIFKIIDDSPSPFESCLNKLFFKLEEKSAFSISKETEVEIDLLERKLKICRRKGQHEKALKINMQIEKLRNMGSITPNPVSRATSPTQINNSNNSTTSEGPDTILNAANSLKLINENDDNDESNSNSNSPAVVKEEKKQFCKIGDNSITFEVEGGGIQNVLVCFSPIPKPGKRQWFGKEEGTGSILIYESKNIDVTKKINYTATVCFDEETYRQNLSLNSSSSELFNSSGNSHFSSISPFSPNNGIKKPFASSVMSPPPLPTSLVKPIPTAAKQQPIVLTVSPAKVDLGEVRIYEDIPFRFQLTNHTGQKVPYDIIVKPWNNNTNNTILTIKDKVGVMEPYGKKNIEVVCQSQVPGKQTHTILIKSSQYNLEISLPVALVPRPPQYVLFPDLPNSQILDFGNCYYDKSKRFSKVVAFKLDNLSHKSLYISMKSNLSMQVFVFTDEKYSKTADNLFLNGYEKTTVYICLRPSMTTENFIDGHCRELVGGIRVKVQDLDHNLLYENTIKFTSIVGKSILRVQKNLIDLGSTRKLGEMISSGFTISNLTTLLPVEYSIAHSKNLKLNKEKGSLEGAEVNHALSKEKITFSLMASVYGLYEERILITNLNCQGQKIEINIRLLVDDESLLTNLPIDSNSCDFLRFDDIYVNPLNAWSSVEDDRKQLSFTISPNQFNNNAINSSQFLYQLNQFTVKNYLKHDIRIYPKSNINLYLFLHEPTKEDLLTINNDKRKSMRLCGKPFILTSDQKVIVYPHPPDPDSIITPKQKSSLLKGRKVKFQGTLVFERSDSTHYPIAPGEGKTHICKLVSISGSYCMSIGRLSIADKSIDIGRIGYENSWKEVFIPIEIKNISEIPLLIRISSIPSKSVRFILNPSNSGGSGGSNSLSSSVTSPSSSSNRIYPPAPSSTTINVINSSGGGSNLSSSTSSTSNLLSGSTSGTESISPIVLDQPIEFQIQSLESKQIVIGIDPTKIEKTTAGPLSLPILFENVHNYFNNMEKSINLYHTLRVLSFGRLLEQGEFVLPTIYHPPLINYNQPSQLDDWFTIENTSNKTLKINSEVELFSQFEQLLQIELVHKASNTPIPSFSLRPSEVIEVRIRSKPRADSRLVEKFEEIVTFGKIILNTNLYPVETIPLRGTILPGNSFSLSVNRLNFNIMSRITNKEGEEQVPQIQLSDSFKIKNTSTFYPLKFKADKIVPQNSIFQGRVVLDPEEGEIPPNEVLSINVVINVPEDHLEDIPPSSSLSLLFNSLECLSEPQKVNINIIGNYKTATSPNNNLLKDKETPSGGSVTSSSSTGNNTPININSTTPIINTTNSANINENLTPIIISSNNKDMTSSIPSSSLTPTITSSTAISLNATTSNVGLVSKENSSSLASTSTSTSSEVEIGLPKLTLKGCTPISKIKNCFEIHLSQQEFSSGTYPWEITLENPFSKAVEYSIYSIRADQDESWLNISRNGGKIESHGRHTITLTFSTKKIDMYSSYLIIENKNNPSDLKTIQITLDVVVKQNSHFSVMVEGKQTPTPSINLGDVYYGITYTDRSFIVSNSSSMPLDFMLSTSLLPTDSTEVCFSLSRSYLRQFNTLYVEPNSQVKVFVYFHSAAPSPPPSTSDIANLLTQKDIKIFLNCRLIRDYQQVINLSATCRYPQLDLSDQNLVFKESTTPTIAAHDDDQQSKKEARDSNLKKSSDPNTSTSTALNTIKSASSIKKFDIEFDGSGDDQCKELIIHNNFDSPLCYVVKESSKFFTIVYNDSESLADKQATGTIKVCPNMNVIMEHSSLLLKEKYLEEHFIIYNQNRLSEKYVVSLRLTTGQLTSFSASSGLKGGYHYRNIEQLVTKFLRKFKKFWFNVYQQSSSSNAITNSGGSSVLNGSNSVLALINNTESIWTTNTNTNTNSNFKLGFDEVNQLENLKDILESKTNTNTITVLYQKLLFDLYHLTNELVLYGLKKQVGQLPSQLATLLYCSLFKHGVFKYYLKSYQQQQQQQQNSNSISNIDDKEENDGKNNNNNSDSNEKSPSKDSGGITIVNMYHNSKLDQTLSILNLSINSLDEFLSYFPEKRDDLNSLRNLQLEITKAYSKDQSTNTNTSSSSGNPTSLNTSTPVASNPTTPLVSSTPTVPSNEKNLNL
ncbi:hypothetical protein CYY_002015 [Polysphondylium violaceum]|uniref:Uncharacterized protein n=1 Tax=Polysphondylium violaceum TaxID=133409 RepID=A0A8J4Q0Y0_9MYCE|nr:hypothetical protein CYY_002015 [Polysphondylium violaceum]